MLAFYVMIMKRKTIYLISFLVAFFTVHAENVIQTQYQINWKGIQAWTANGQSKTVLAFDGALYPDDTYLPYFTKRIDADQNATYTVQLADEVFVPATAQESQVVSGSTTSLSENVTVETQTLTQRGQNYLDIRILPFVLREGKIYKLSTFTFSVTQVKAQLKSKAATIHTYADKSVLAEGKFVKIKIESSGVYKLTYEDLVSMGITSPANVSIYGYGGAMLDQSFLIKKNDDLPEVPVYMNKGSDGVFNSGDYILFYATGINKWTYDAQKLMFVHTINIYSKYGYYFVSSGSTEGKRMSDENTAPDETADIYPVEEFVDYDVHEKELINLIKSGKEFYGETYTETSTKNISFTSPNILTGTSSLKVRLDVAATASEISTFSLALNSSQVKTLSVPKKSEDNYEIGKSSSGIFTFTPPGNSLSFDLLYTAPTTSSKGYLNYIEINARRNLKMYGSAMQFQNVDYLYTDSYNQYKISDCNSNVQVWNITNAVNLTKVNTQTVDGKLTFYSGNDVLRQYIAIDPTNSSAFPKPSIVGVVSNQNIHGMSPVDMVIITDEKFTTQAEKLAQAHREMDNMTVAVVTTTQVYNEFSSGAPDATAYRWIMKMLYDRALASGNTDDLPKYLLLIGRGSYDNRKLLSTSGENLILTYQAENSLVETSSYVTDDYFALLDDNEGASVPSNLLDIGVGRFPVSTTDQATVVVDKTISYMKNEQKGMWKNQLCFLADDGDAALHMKQADTISSVLGRNNPGYQVNKIYLDAYNQQISASGETYPLARAQFHNFLQSGMLLLDYTGHAASTGWTNEQILTTSDVKNLTNKNLPLWVGATCDFLQFDGETASAGEYVLLNSEGGGIGIISAARPVYASQNMTLNKYICDNLFKKKNGENLRVGDIISAAKNSVGSEINKLSYVYMGDPAVRLNYPTKYNIVTTQINDDATLQNDTLKALSVVTIKGKIADSNSNTITGFNGVLSLTVYDKVQRITTLNNHNDGALTYSDRPNVLFSGKADVIDGEFTVTFMLPKDIKYNYGGGRINYYAYDTTNSADEAQGYYENFIVGGSNTDIEYETEGPDMNLYLNNANFVSGGKVNETPLFYAILSDQNGINRVGSGIGHDIVLTIDEDPDQTYIMNDYFESDANTYTSGSIKYRLPSMDAGKHTLTFRAWDLLNNSTTKSLDFEVVEGLSPEIFAISNYPNPVKASTRIVVDYDRPETILDTKVEIFDISGRRMWYFDQSNADDIVWNLSTLDGKKAKTGIYLYRVTISLGDDKVYSKMNKMIILEQ